MLRHILSASVLIIALFSITIKCEEFLECLHEEIGEFIPVVDNCSKAIYCNGMQSAIVDCGEKNPYFSAKDKMCSDDITVCNERFSTGVPTTTIAEEATTTTTGRPTPTTTTSKPTPPRFSTTTVATSTVTSTPKVESTTGFITTTSAYSSSSRPTPAVLPTIPVASSSTIKTTTTTTTTRNPSTMLVAASTTPVIATAAPSTDGRLSCPLQDDPIRPLYLPHPQSCAQYYLCYHGTPMVMHCPNMLLFDVIQQSCNSAVMVNCQLSSISTPPRQCLPHTVTVYPHPKNCNYYYRCEYGYLKVMQCPFGMGWDYEMAICTQLSQAKCYKPAQRYFI